MTKKSNGSVMKELAFNQLKFHKTRNMVMIIAIILTSVLLSTIFTVGGGFFVAMDQSSQASPGPGADGGIESSLDKFEDIKAHDKVLWADYVRKCSLSSLQNKEFAGVQTKLYAPDFSFYKHNMITIKTGRFPEKADEIIISDTMADRLDTSVGDSIILDVIIQQEQQDVKIGVKVNICGIYSNPLYSLSSYYEELYTAPQFITTYNPEIQEYVNNITYVKLKNLNPLLLKTDIYNQLLEIKEDTNAGLVLTRHYSNLASSLVMVIPIALFVSIVILCGYLLIYNVLNMSIAADIRWFGVMKNIGATTFQLKKILKIQFRILSVIGIALGSMIGYLIGALVAPRIMDMTDFSIYYKAVTPVPVIILTIVFASLTVYISSRKSIKIASSISPIEASKYVPKKKNKMISMLSFAISAIVFLIVCNVTIGYRVDKMVDRYNNMEAVIYHSAVHGSQEGAYQPIKKKLAESIGNLSFVKDTYVSYSAKDYVNISENDLQGHGEFTGEVKLDGKLEKEVTTMLNSGLLSLDDGIININDRGNLSMVVSGLPVTRLKAESEYLSVIEGTIDEAQFASGDYILYQSLDMLGEYLNGAEYGEYIHAGDQLVLSFYNPKTESYIEREVTVMAVVKTNDYYGTGVIGLSNLIMPDEMFKDIYPDYEKMISHIQIEANRKLDDKETDVLTNLVMQENNSQIKFKSRVDSWKEFQHAKNSNMIIGIFLAVTIGLIGISNMINTSVTNALSRKKEFATIQSIGMTRRQLKQLLFKENLLLYILSLLIVIPFGAAATGYIANSLFSGFNLSAFLISLVLVVLIIFALCFILANVIANQLNKKSLTERLENND